MSKAPAHYKILVFLSVLASCTNKAPVTDVSQEHVQTPVTTTTIMQEPLEQFVELTRILAQHRSLK